MKKGTRMMPGFVRRNAVQRSGGIGLSGWDWIIPKRIALRWLNGKRVGRDENSYYVTQSF
jgi:hypothetical protein